jgi:hypothetical protein
MVRADHSLGRRCISHWRHGALYGRQRVHALPYSVPDIRVRKQAKRMNSPFCSTKLTNPGPQIRGRFGNHVPDAVVVQSLVGWSNPMGQAVGGLALVRTHHLVTRAATRVA